VPDSLWENYKSPDPKDSTKQRDMAQAPQAEGGAHYIVTNARAWPWTCKLTGTVELGVSYLKDKDGSDVEVGEIEYGFALTASRRSKSHCYTDGQKEQEWVISISVGHMNESTNRLVPWQTRAAVPPQPESYCIMLGDKKLLNSLFWQTNESGEHWPAWRVQPDELADDDMLDDMVRSSSILLFITIPSHLCLCVGRSARRAACASI